MKKLKEILKKKHLLIIGKTEIERKKFISELIKVVNYQTFRFPKQMKTLDDYVDFVKKNKIYNAWSESQNINAVMEFHEDWLIDNNSLVILDEFQYMEEPWKLEIIRMFLNQIDYKKKGKDAIHLIISQENEDNLVEKLANSLFPIRENERRTKKQIIEQNLKIIDISKI